MMCINCDITTGQKFYNEMTTFYNVSAKPIPNEETETDDDVYSIIKNLIDNIFNNMDTTNITRKRAVEIIKFMDEKGIFLVKGAIDQVAARMGVSRVTIYSYLDEAKGKR